MRNKKGSHVGFMLSFVIFITFIVFLLVAFNPKINFQKSKESVLDQLEIELLAMIDSDLTNIENAANQYNINDAGYEDLKNDLSVPDNLEFAFIFRDNEGPGGPIIYTAEKNLPENINIYTREVFVLYIDPVDDEDYGGFLTIKIW